MSNIVYINTHAAKYGWYFGRRMPEGYRLAAKFWGSGLLDRTRTLYTGFPYQCLYPIPLTAQGAQASGADIGALCDAQADRIVTEASHTGREIQLLWSGGIDSTVALVGIIKAATAHDLLHAVEVLLTENSVSEYPLFFERFVKLLRFRYVAAPVTTRFDPTRLIVTGEHGDQIFGSAKVASYVADGRAFESHSTVLPPILAESLGSTAKADAVVRFIEPLLHACPIRLGNIFDVFWWLNFTLKWQVVGLRLAVFRIKGVRQTFESLRHFFSHPDFQVWSLQNHDRKIAQSWESYKMPLKDYIYAFTGDADYRRTKIKVPSLKAVFVSDTRRRAPTYRVLMDEDFVPVFWRVDADHDREDFLKIPRQNRGR